MFTQRCKMDWKKVSSGNGLTSFPRYFLRCNFSLHLPLQCPFALFSQSTAQYCLEVATLPIYTRVTTGVYICFAYCYLNARRILQCWLCGFMTVRLVISLKLEMWITIVLCEVKATCKMWKLSQFAKTTLVSLKGT